MGEHDPATADLTPPLSGPAPSARLLTYPRPERATVSPANGGLAEEAGPPPSTTCPVGRAPGAARPPRHPLPIAQTGGLHTPTTDRIDRGSTPTPATCLQGGHHAHADE